MVSYRSCEWTFANTHHLAADLLAVPFDFPSATYDFLHPEKYARSEAHAKWYEPLECTTEHLAYDNCSNQDACAQVVGACLEGGKHGLIAD